MQLNFVVMALAGAQRIFALLDEKPETDEGYVDAGQRQSTNADDTSPRVARAHRHVGLEAARMADGTLTLHQAGGRRRL